MNLYSNIISIINTSVSDMITAWQTANSSTMFNNFQLNGIASDVPKDGKYYPAVIAADGESWDYISFDDTLTLRCFHKNLGQIQAQKQVGQQFGDNETTYKNTSSFSLVIMYKRDSLLMIPEDLGAFIQTGIPSNITGTLKTAGFKINSCIVSDNIINVDFKSLYNRDFAGFPFDVKTPDMSLLEIKYKIECSYDNSCINIIN